MRPIYKKKPLSQRFKTQPRKASIFPPEQASLKRNSIVFQSQIKSLQNYFQFLQNTFGKNIEISRVIKNIPHEKSINKEYSKLIINNCLMSQRLHNNASLYHTREKSQAKEPVDEIGLPSSHRNLIKYSLLQQPSQQLKFKFENSLRKRHSFLMQKLSETQNKTHTAPINRKRNAKQYEVSQFCPLGHSMIHQEQKTKEPYKINENIQIKLKKGITYKKHRHHLIIVKNQSQVRAKATERNDYNLVQEQGPWDIVDSNEYNPRSFYSTYR